MSLLRTVAVTAMCGLVPIATVAQAQAPVAVPPAPVAPKAAPPVVKPAVAPAKPAVAPIAPAGKPAVKPVPPANKAGDKDKSKPPRDAQAVRDKLRQSIRTMRAQKLAEVLKPDAATAQKLQEISDKYGEDVLKLREQAGATRREMKKLVDLPKPDAAAVGQLTEQYLTLRGKINQLEDEREAAVRKVLTPEQFARYLIAWPAINRQIQDLINQALRGRDKSARGDEL